MKGDDFKAALLLMIKDDPDFRSELRKLLFSEQTEINYIDLTQPNSRSLSNRPSSSDNLITDLNNNNNEENAHSDSLRDKSKKSSSLATNINQMNTNNNTGNDLQKLAISPLNHLSANSLSSSN